MSRAREAQIEASRWIIAREEGNVSESAEADFYTWLESSDMNRVAFLRLEKGWREADRIQSAGAHLKPHSLRGGTRWLAGEVSQRRWLSLAITVTIIIGMVFGWQNYRSNFDRTNDAKYISYRTKIGGRKNIALLDGSIVELNTASVIRTAMSFSRREVWLDRGEAYFEVRHDPARPFTVHAGNRIITVLGTKFSVKIYHEKISVLVREGRVRLDGITKRNTPGTRTLGRGDFAITQGNAVLIASESERQLGNALSWRRGILSFDHASLTDVVAEFNRYNHKRLFLSDRDVGDMQIGGMFPARKPGDFALLLRDAYGLRVDEQPGMIRISK